MCKKTKKTAVWILNRNSEITVCVSAFSAQIKKKLMESKDNNSFNLKKRSGWPQIVHNSKTLKIRMIWPGEKELSRDLLCSMNIFPLDSVRLNKSHF